MIMVRHQAICGESHAEFLVCVAQDLEKIIPIFVREKDHLSLVPSGVNVVEGARMFDPQLTSHWSSESSTRFGLASAAFHMDECYSDYFSFGRKAKSRHSCRKVTKGRFDPFLSYPVSYTHLRAHETDSYLVCRLL